MGRTKPPPAERTAARTMRRYIKAWITQRDLQRLIGASVRTVERPVESNYEEAEGLGESAPADTEEC